MTSGAPAGSRTATGTLMVVLAPLVWIPQAALLAAGIGRIASGDGAAAVVWLAVGVVALGALRAGLEHAGGRRAFRAARARLSQHRAEATARLAAVSPLDVRRPPSGLAASVLAEEAEAVTPYLARFRPARLRAAVVPLAIVLAVLPFSWVAALALLLAAPAIPVFMALIGWRAQAASAARLVEAGSLNAFLLDRLRGLATIRGLGAVELTADRLRTEAERFRAGTMAVLRIAFLSSAVLELFAALGVAMVAVWVGFHLLGTLGFGTWGGRLTLGQGVFVLLLAPAFFEPLRELAAVWHDRAAGEAAIAALEGLGRDAASLPAGDAAPASAAVTAPAIAVRGLRYRPPGAAEDALADLDLDVAPGEAVALMAPSGAGKSTLLALLAGLAEPDEGRILVDGAPLPAAARRAGVAWLGQRPALFAGSLARNVTLGRPEVGPATVKAALDFVHLGSVAAARGATPIGEGGLGLSGGEALRLAIARAAATPHARLILADEPTAHLDAATADEITGLLLSLGRGRTLVIATHDPRLAARLGRTIALAPRLEVAA